MKDKRLSDILADLGEWFIAHPVKTSLGAIAWVLWATILFMVVTKLGLI